MWLLKPSEQFIIYKSLQEQDTSLRYDDSAFFCTRPRYWEGFCLANSLKQQSTDRYVALFGHIYISWLWTKQSLFFHLNTCLAENLEIPIL